jgi:putative two-component system response regulator
MARETIRVLLVEDNPVDVELLRVMLRTYPRARFEVDSVGSTQECLEALKENSFDLLLLDYKLPREDGVSFLRRVAGREDIPPVIMLTGVGDERVAAEAMRLGAYDYYPKDSISSEMLARAIHQVLEKFRLDQQLENTEQVIFTLAAAVEAKDPTAERHLQNIARYAVRLGQALGLEQHQLMLLRYGGILHDIGKVGVSEAILSKPGPLTEAEWEKMRQHPVIGERICAPLRFSHEVGPIIRHHHERWDGQGYVDSLSGEKIPLLARVISVVDAFDTMSSDRPYRKALPIDETVRRLSDGAGTQWDPAITRVFLELVECEGLGDEELERSEARG